MGSAKYGFIQDFYGNVNTIPRGWYICDGTNGTPDLRGMFIVGYDPRDSEYNQVGKTGGLKNVTLTEGQMPSQRHTMFANSTDLAIYDAMTQDDVINRGREQSGSNFQFVFRKNRQSMSPTVGRTSDSGEHSHTMDLSNTGGGQSHENRPPFYTMIKIMFKGE